MLSEFVAFCLEGIDLDKYHFLVPLITSFIIIVTVALVLRAIMGIFDIFFPRKGR